MTFRFYTHEQLGPKQSLTPEHFLLCASAPVARTGSLLYAAGEVPVTPSQDGIVRISRDESEVFHPDAIASFNGKAVTHSHPPEKVGPGNYRSYQVGTVMNAHRGNGLDEDSQFLYCDLMIYDPDTIAAIRSGQRELSAGYDADYEEIATGHGIQKSIRGNHVALVERGRCGPACAIGDQAIAIEDEGKVMVANPKKPTADAFAKFRAAIKDAESAIKELKEIEGMNPEVLSGVDEFPEKKPEPANNVVAETPSDRPHVVNVHVGSHGGAAPASGAVSAPPAAEKGDVEAAPGATGGGEQPMAAGAEGNDPASLAARIDRLEQAVAILVQGDDPEPEQDNTPPARDAAPKQVPAQDKKPAVVRDEAEEERKLEAEAGDKKTVVKDTREAQDSAWKPVGSPPKATVKDSANLQVEYQRVRSLGEILVPGMAMPTFDAKAPATTTIDTICNYRKQVLAEAWKHEASRNAVNAVTMSDQMPRLKDMSCDSAGALFNAAAAIMRQQNNNGIKKPASNVAVPAGTPSITEINKRNREFYGR